MTWLTWTLIIIAGTAGLILLAMLLFMFYILWNYSGIVIRIFEEKPFFIIPKGQPIADAENVRFPSTRGLTLAGCYLRTPQALRRGVILFGTEFGSNRWSCHSYCRQLLANGFDVFSFEFRNTGDSDTLSGYEPLQWVTEHEIEDMRAAVAYLKGRPDADPAGVGLFGISRGGGAGLFVAAEDPAIRCIATDGAFATLTTMMPYMRKWVAIYSDRLKLQNWLPDFAYASIGRIMLRRLGKRRNCQFPQMEKVVAAIRPRPWFMIHGGADTYIKPSSTQALFARAGQPKELWLVEGAKHNQAIHTAAEEYQRRIVAFFNLHLAPAEPPAEALPAPRLAASA